MYLVCSVFISSSSNCLFSCKTCNIHEFQICGYCGGLVDELIYCCIVEVYDDMMIWWSEYIERDQRSMSPITLHSTNCLQGDHGTQCRQCRSRSWRHNSLVHEIRNYESSLQKVGWKYFVCNLEYLTFNNLVSTDKQLTAFWRQVLLSHQFFFVKEMCVLPAKNPLST